MERALDPRGRASAASPATSPSATGWRARWPPSEARYRTLDPQPPELIVVTYDHDLRYTFAAGDALATAGPGPGRPRAARRVRPSTPRRSARAIAPRSAGSRRRSSAAPAITGADRPATRRRRRHRGQEHCSPRTSPPSRAAGRELTHGTSCSTTFEEAPDRHGRVNRRSSHHLRRSTRRCPITGYTEEQLLGTPADDSERIRTTSPPRRDRLLLNGAGTHRKREASTCTPTATSCGCW